MERTGTIPAILGPYNLVDIGTGVLATFATGLAVYHPLVTGTGQHGHTSLAQTATLEASTLEHELEARFATLPATVWIDRLRQAGVSAHAVVPVAELMVDPWVRSQGLSVTQTVEDVGEVTMPGLSVRLSATPMRLGSPPRRPGSDAAPILQELGIAEALPALARAWVLQTADLPPAW
jgi:crotonobetainyl-CoA:carnitine CoA-transferase CaiB-like acyl-CoA transferase